MSFSIDRRRLLLGTTGLAMAPAFARAQGRPELFEVTRSETATIDGRHWDTTFPGGMTVDAVHRSVLVRFPTAAEDIAHVLRRGRVLMKAELSLAYHSYEIVPEGYLCRDGLGRKVWTESPPTWHVQAWPLRQPWVADKANGPTFNASVDGRRYWARFGAADLTKDRFPEVDTPQELSLAAREARFDITKILSTPFVERDAGERLRWLEHCGFLLRKLETYDTRYREPGNAYEWAMPVGGHGLRFARPRLLLTCRPVSGGIVSVSLPPDVEREWHLRTADGSAPTAVMLTAAEVAERSNAAMRVSGPRQAWELARIEELRRLGGDDVSRWANLQDEKGYRDYLHFVREMLSMPPRYWQGWSIADYLLISLVFDRLLPTPLQEHLKNYWRAWLQSDVPTSSFFHPQSPEAMDYWKRTRDWRGRASFFRAGYNFAVSTQNFNHTAAMGALLGGTLVGSDNAMADGRHGLEALLLRFWAFLDGSSQELLDHYYLSITLSAQKMFADYAPTAIDRLKGRILTDRTMEMLITAFHPRLRRFISSSGRSRISGLLVEQDGVYAVLHTVSKEGTVNYTDQPPPATVHGMPIWGYDFPPGRVAIQAVKAPWAPSWVSGLVDDKPVPFEETAAETIRNNFKQPLWRRVYIGQWHGLASTDIKASTIDVMAQWVREPRRSNRLEDIGTLTARYVANEPNLATTIDGTIPQAGLTLTYQSRNRAIVFAKPHTNRDRFLEGVGMDRAVSRLATVIGLWNFMPTPDWRIDSSNPRYILIRDGVTYLALMPLPANDLGREVAMEIGPGGGGPATPTDKHVAPALIVSLYNMKRSKPVPIRDLDFRAILTRTYNGFVIEMGDEAQYGSFENFARHIDAAELKATWHEGERRVEIAYRSGSDLMEAAFGTDFGQSSELHFPINPGSLDKAIPWRRLNGQWPYLPPGLERDTSWSQQGVAGRLEKNGAVLTSEAGRKAYLLADPLSGGVVAYNPIPDPQTWALATRDGVSVRADGKIGLLRLEYRPWAREVEIDHAPKPGQGNLAKTMTVTGLTDPPRVTVNGRPAIVTATGTGFQIGL
ncbi:MAG: hypothetical protein KIT25_24280 [Enhydrobacter sp.]|nr:MAG: hypothetical protein KIT25_24280 [Enhydrobacter sp.]